MRTFLLGTKSHSNMVRSVQLREEQEANLIIAPIARNGELQLEKDGIAVRIKQVQLEQVSLRTSSPSASAPFTSYRIQGSPHSSLVTA